MIEIKYKCQCMATEVALQLIPRDPARDIVEWMETIVQPAIGYDHRTRSPRCHRTKMEYAKIPLDLATNAAGAYTMTEVLERPADQLSRIPPGHWRCKWRRDPRYTYVFPAAAFPSMIPGTIVIDQYTWISPPRFLTRERADEDGRKYTTFNIHYVEAVHFPGEAP